MKTTISDKIYIENASEEMYQYCRENLVIPNPLYETLFRLNKMDQIVRCHVPEKMSLYADNGFKLILPSGCLRAIWNLINKGEIEVKFNKENFISCKDNISQPLFDYQEEAVNKLLEAKSGILIGGCGSGKTNVGIELAKRIGFNCLWLCHTKDLLKQTVKRIKSLFPHMNVGTITEGKVDMVSDGITVSTIQTLVNVDNDIYVNNFGTVIVDEAHHVNGSPTLMKYFVRVINKIPARYKFGLTATDRRNDSLTKSMYAYIGCNLKGEYEPVWRIDRNDVKTLTARHEKIELDTPFDFSMLNDDGTFNFSNMVDYIAKNNHRNKVICEKVMEMKKEGRKQLILCSRIEQCELLHKMLTDLGVKSELLIGKVSSKKRESVLNQTTDWDVIVATVSLAKEGLDIVDLDTLHLVSCIGNKSDTVQSVGRIERFKENKKEPIVFDYVDTKISYLVSKYKKRAGWLRRR